MKAFVVNQKPSEQKLSIEDRNLKAKELLNKRKAEFNDDLDEVKSPRKVKSNKRKKTEGEYSLCFCLFGTKTF